MRPGTRTCDQLGPWTDQLNSKPFDRPRPEGLRARQTSRRAGRRAAAIADADESPSEQNAQPGTDFVETESMLSRVIDVEAVLLQRPKHGARLDVDVACLASRKG